MSINNAAKIFVQGSKDKDILKTQFDSADTSAYFQFFADQVTGSDRGLRIKQKEVTSSADVFILGNPPYGVLGTNKLGDTGMGVFTTIRVVQPGNTYKENFYSDFYKDTTGTATWGTTGELVL